MRDTRLSRPSGGKTPAPKKSRPAPKPQPHASEISAGLPTPHEQRRLSKTTLTPAQQRAALKLVRAYQAGPKPGSGSRTLLRLANAYEHNPVARSPVIGRKGLLGGVEDLVKSVDPVALEQTLARRAKHPLRMDKGINAGIVFPGGGFRVPKVAADVTAGITRAEAEARLAKIDAAQAKVEAAVEGKYKTVDRSEQNRRNKINGLIGKYERKGEKGRQPGTSKALRAGHQPTVSDQFSGRAIDDFLAKNPKHPVAKAWVARAAEGERLREMLNAQHLPGETSVDPFAPKREPMPRVRPVTGKDQNLFPHEAPREVVAKSLGSAGRLAAEQKRLGKEERAARVGKAQAASKEAGGGVAGHYAGLAEQRGELPKTTFARLREGQLSQDDIEKLVRQIDQHPELQFYGKQNARQALLDAFEHGRTPRPHEIKLLQTVFGQDAADALVHRALGAKLISALTLPRTLEATADISATARQGLVAGAGHPRIFARNFPKQLKALVSKRAYDEQMNKIHERPNYQQMLEHGVKFTDLSGDVGKREEAFMSDLAEKVPVLGHAVRASGRAYTSFLNNLRADIFDSMVKSDAKRGVNVEDHNYLRSVARYANAATGRGSMGRLEHMAPAANTLFFSPRLIAARLNMLNPVWYKNLHPAVRRQALKSMATLIAATAGGLELGQLAGGKVGTDPRSADFAKLRLGNTRIDPLGGFQQYARAAAQIGSGKIVSSTTGKTMTLGRGFGKMNRWDIIERFLLGKANPTAGAAVDLLKQQTYQGQPLKWQNELAGKLTPLSAQDAYSTYQQTKSLPLAIGGYGLAASGVGLQSYGPRDVAKEEAAKASTAAKQQDVHLHNLVRQGVLPRAQMKEYRKALDLLNERDALNRTIEHAVPDDHPRTREIRKLVGLVDLLQQHGRMSKQRADEYRHAYKTSTQRSVKDLRADRKAFWDETVGPMITWYHDKAGKGLD